MKKIILLLLISVKSFSQLPSRDYINILSERFKYPDIYVILPLVKKHIIMTNYSLHNYYLKNMKIHKKENYQGFLVDIFNGREDLDITKLSPKSYEIINPNLAILDQYRKYGLDYIIKKYLIPTDGKFRNSHMNQSDLNGLIEIMFNNKYLVFFSDYSGDYRFVKQS